MDVEALERAIVAAREGTGKGAGAPFFVNATSGSTVMVCCCIDLGRLLDPFSDPSFIRIHAGNFFPCSKGLFRHIARDCRCDA